MQIIDAWCGLINPFSDKMDDREYMIHMLQHIERIGRVCYKSEDKITNDSYIPFINGIIKRGHEAMLEHGSFTIKFVVDRGVSHELVRHRMASFAQESTRYCNYGKSGDVVFIKPCFFEEDSPEMDNWIDACMRAEQTYFSMLDSGRSPQEARSVLPNSLKTEVLMTANFREWRHFFKLRATDTTGKPHPQMLEVTQPMLRYLKQICPVIFNDIGLSGGNPNGRF